MLSLYHYDAYINPHSLGQRHLPFGGDKLDPLCFIKTGTQVPSHSHTYTSESLRPLCSYNTDPCDATLYNTQPLWTVCSDNTDPSDAANTTSGRLPSKIRTWGTPITTCLQ